MDDSYASSRRDRRGRGAFGIAGLIVVILSVWVARITPSWVMIPAREYANRLME